MDGGSHISGNSAYTSGHGPSSANRVNPSVKVWSKADDKMGKFLVTGTSTAQQRAKEAAQVVARTNQALGGT